ncbi:MAG: 23S rRNA (guanosine(2251)-2'-O)-methyltransferase RlmB [Proteobacteria bacterium]|nr:23S rRNA (guanosine(2251)-2'-O)-methyltransferase RlmB [Pseudomonadota bacterium]
MKRILAGPHAVTEVLHSTPGSIEVICVAESMRPTSVRRIEELARRARVSVELLPKNALDQIAKELLHQGVIAITGSYPYLDMDGLLAATKKEVSPLILALDQIQDPRNLGAIIRSAYAFGASGLVIPKDRSASVTSAAVRTSAGASELIRTVRVTNLVRCLDRLRDEGFQIFGATMDGNARLEHLPWQGRCVLVLGNESRGLRRLTSEHCDYLFTIPLSRNFDSLNVSAAASIALYEAARLRFPGKNGNAG